VTPQEMEAAAQASVAKIRNYWWLIAGMIEGELGDYKPTRAEVKLIACRVIEILHIGDP